MLLFVTQKRILVIVVLFYYFSISAFSNEIEKDSIQYFKNKLKSIETLPLDSVIYFYKKAKENADTPELIMLIRNETRYLTDRGFKDVVCIELQRALELAKTNKLKVLEGLLLYDLSNYYYYFNQFKLAYQTILESKTKLELITPLDLKNYNKTKEKEFSKKELLEPVLFNIGTMALDNGDYQKAEEHFIESLNLSMIDNDQQGILDAKINLANLLLEKGEHKKSNKAFFEMLIDSIPSHGDLSLIYYNIAANYIELGKNKKSLKYIDKAITSNEKTGDSLQLIDLNYLKAQILSTLGDYKNAEILFNKSLEASIGIDDQVFQIQLYKNLAELAIKNNKFKKATYYFQKLIASQDTLKKHDELGSFSEILLENKLDQQESLNVKQQSIIKYEKERSKLYFSVVALSIFFIIALISYFIVSRKNTYKRIQLLTKEAQIKEIELKNKRKDEITKAKQVQDELSQSKRELLLSLLYIKKRKERTKEIQKEVNRIKERSVITKQDLLNLKDLIQKKSDELDKNEHIQQKIDAAHKDFFTNILKSFPSLTATELKILVYLRINLSTKEIASLQNVSVDAIRKTRYRIRKKLNLSPKQSLEKFIINLY